MNRLKELSQKYGKGNWLEKLNETEHLLEERYLLLKFLEDKRLLFDAYEYITKIRGEKREKQNE